MPYKDVLKSEAIRSENPCDWLILKNCRNAFRDNEGISRMTWRIINDLTSRKIHSSPLKEIKFDYSSIKDPQELSSAFDDHFSRIGVINAIQLI